MIFSNLKFSKAPIAILDNKIPLEFYMSIDLSSTNKELKGVDITNPDSCQKYIDEVLARNEALVAYGGYLEKRNLYDAADRFSKGSTRNIHLGIDFWCEAGTQVITPITGTVHSFSNNDDIGNYGPTIILEHKFENILFYSLYGHLSIESLYELFIGKKFRKGETLATLGTPDINVNYAPHLHFQIINDLGSYQGDYPGVCSESDLDFYKTNCPDPNLLLQLY